MTEQEQKVIHYPTCTADYPEKVPNEKPQQIISFSIGDGDTVHQCVDCGAFILVHEENE